MLISSHLFIGNEIANSSYIIKAIKKKRFPKSVYFIVLKDNPLSLEIISGLDLPFFVKPQNKIVAIAANKADAFNTLATIFERAITDGPCNEVLEAATRYNSIPK